MGAAIPGSHDGSLSEVIYALHWLARLLEFRLHVPDTPRDDAKESSGLTAVLGLLEEFARITGDSHAVPEGPPEIPAGGWLPRFARKFGLNALETLLIVAAVAPSFDGRFAAGFGEARGLPGPERATCDLLGRLLAFPLNERAKLAAYLSPGGRLEQFGLLKLDWSDNATLPLNLQPLLLPERVHRYLLDGSDSTPPALQPILDIRGPRWALRDAPLPLEVLSSLHICYERFARALDAGEVLPLLLLEGPPGAGQLEAAECLARELDIGLLEIDLSPVPLGELPALVTLFRREAALRGCALMLHMQSEDPLSPALHRRIRLLLGRELQELRLPVIATGNLAALALLTDIGRPILRIELRAPDRALQRRVLERTLEAEHVSAEDRSLEHLLNRYSLNLQTAEEVVHAARVLARSSRSDGETLQRADLQRAVEMVLTRNLSGLSQRLPARYGWEDLIVPNDIITQLKTLSNLIEYRYKVFDEWGLGKKDASGQGVKALFSGPSGTGKSMAAQVVANELGMPIYRVDLSAIVSKWIGETEKNLEKIFKEAQGSQAILLFDEADALFGKRGDVKNSQDRHSNVEVSFLLQRFETHGGPVILTSNFPTIIDKAFARRMHFLIDFPAPDEKMRLRLWKKLLVSTLPMADDLDLSWLVRFEISGANIRNTIMGAAFLAAAEDNVVRMSQLVRALGWEYQKLGRVPGAGEFGSYYDYLETRE